MYISSEYQWRRHRALAILIERHCTINSIYDMAVLIYEIISKEMFDKENSLTQGDFISDWNQTC